MKKTFLKCHQDINVAAYFMNCMNFSFVFTAFLFSLKKSIFTFHRKATYLKHSSVYMLTSNSQFIPPPVLPLPGNHQFIL